MAVDMGGGGRVVGARDGGGTPEVVPQRTRRRACLYARARVCGGGPNELSTPSAPALGKCDRAVMTGLGNGVGLVAPPEVDVDGGPKAYAGAPALSRSGERTESPEHEMRAGTHVR